MNFKANIHIPFPVKVLEDCAKPNTSDSTEGLDIDDVIPPREPVKQVNLEEQEQDPELALEVINQIG